MKMNGFFKPVKRCLPALMVTSFWLLFSSFYTTRVLAGSTITIVYPTGNNTYEFATSELKKTLETSGYVVYTTDITNLDSTAAGNRIVLTERGTNEVYDFLNQPGISPLPGAFTEGYSFRKKTDSAGTDWFIIAVDKNGILYGTQDFGRAVQLYGLGLLAECDKKPYIANRGIKFNIPLDARTPGYSDNGNAAQKNIPVMWDSTFWHQFLDNMARNRFNMLSLWSLCPFPSMVEVPGYPNAGLSDVKQTTAPFTGFKTLTGTNMSNPTVLANLVTIKTITLAEKIAFWQHVMEYARDRGISCYLFTWNIFTFGLENSGYGFTPAAADLKTKDYFRKATKALISTYPLLKGIGITAGENMNGLEADDERFLYESYGEGINDALAEEPDRSFVLIHRAHQSTISVIKNAFTALHPRCSLRYSYKYSGAHLYSSVAPDYIYKAKFLENIGSAQFFLTVRDDDWYYLRGGSDPAFARAYLKKIPQNNFSGFYLGPDGYTWGKDYISKDNDFYGGLVFDKRWYSFSIWGELAYDPELPDSLFTGILKTRFPAVNSQDLFNAWAAGSQVVPLVNRFHNVGCQSDYQWYPEACFSNGGFHDVNRFISTGPQSNEGLLSIPLYTDAVLKNTAVKGTTPLQVAQNLLTVSNTALSLINNMAGNDKELRQSISDITCMAYLGQYYAKKILGATNKSLADKTTDSTKRQKFKSSAISYLREAAECWRNYANQLSSSYTSQWLTRMQQNVDVTAIQSKVDNDILLAGGTINRVAVTGITVNPSVVYVLINSTAQLTATVTPVTATNKNVRWSSANNSIATVTPGGLVKAASLGSVVITATSLDGSKMASCTINVADSNSIVNVPGSWKAGPVHEKIAGVNRALVVFVYGEHPASLSVNSVKYGGKTMIPVIQKNVATSTNSFTGAFVLNEAGIVAASTSGIAVNWVQAPANAAIISVFLSNVDQLAMVGSKGSGGNTYATTVATGALATTPGDVALVAATAANSGSGYLVNNNFIKGLPEQSPLWGDIVAGYKVGTGTSETPSVTMPASMRQSVIGFVLRVNRATKVARTEDLRIGYQKEMITVYPNPVNNHNLTVDFHRFVEKGVAQFFALSGKMVTSTIFSNAFTLNLNTGKLAKGVYVLQIDTHGGGVFNKKVIIQ